VSETTTKQALLRAAITVFADKGYLSARVREICALAGANAAAVNYHYGGKEALYAAVLEHIFTHSHPDAPLEPAPDEPDTPRAGVVRHVRRMIRDMYALDGDSGVHAELGRIFIRELAAPSDNLTRLIERYALPKSAELGAVIREYLGPNASEETVFNCVYSLRAQVMHGIVFWPVIREIRPGYADMQDLARRIEEHVIAFTMGGLEAVRRTLEKQRGKK